QEHNVEGGPTSYRSFAVFRYDAQYPDSSKTYIDAAFERQKVTSSDKKPTFEPYSNTRDEWRPKYLVTRLLRIQFASKQFFADWKVAESDDSK
ncbi:Hypothetical predicted protein, partial [Paramuricea clavata]